jgi:hypothetical protein
MQQEISDAIQLLESAKSQEPDQATSTVNQVIQLLLSAFGNPAAPDVDKGT